MSVRRTKKNQLHLMLEDITVEGSIISPEYMIKIAQNKATYQTEDDYLIDKALTLREEVVRYYKIAAQIWKQYYLSNQDTEAIESYFPLMLKRCFGFDSISTSMPDDVYPVHWFAQQDRIPIIFAQGNQDLDKAYPEYGDGYRNRSPFALLQEYLNAKEPALWGIVTNGKVLRIARDNLSLTRPAFIEIDLEHIFNTDKYSEFNIAWLLLHETRFGKYGDMVTDCPLEYWRTEGQKEGSRVRENLRVGVENAVRILGQAFLKEPSNTSLRAKFCEERLTAQTYYNQLLRLIYRFIFLITAEEREVLHPPKSTKTAKELYEKAYSMRFLRERASRRLARDRHTDLYEIVRIVFKGLENGETRLALPALGGLFAHEQCADLIDCKLQNMDLLEALYPLMWMREGTQLARINWRDMGTEELGSVYEGLLEVVPVVADNAHTFAFANENAGNERKTTGSYYTPPSLVQVIIDNTLTPVIDRTLARNPSEPDKALLKLTICDPACGSGHFLLAAARKLANEIARLRTNGAPSAEDFRTAIREVIGKCIYGVDINPMAVELCRVALWMEALKPGQPLTFLDSHIQCGNSLSEATQDSVNDGIPDEAWEMMKGEDKKICNELKKRNKSEREGQLDRQGDLFENRIFSATMNADEVQEIEDLSDETLDNVKNKAKRWYDYRSEPSYTGPKHLCDIWSSAFLWPKTKENKDIAPTYKQFELIKKNPQRILDPQFESIVRELTQKHRIFHWHLEFPQVFKNGGFDCIIANPPYIQLQSMNTVNNLMSFTHQNTYDSSGDIYCLFYEQAMQLLKRNGYAGILSSNKWMRAGYGQKIRSYFATKTNPKLLVDFSGIKLFEAATVDVNILVLQKSANEEKTHTCIMKQEGINNMGVFIKHNGGPSAYTDPDGPSWAILSPIERSIKAKIEAVGTPLKDWDIQINYGIKTGCNEAFIIDGAKRAEILGNCKTDEERERTDALIRPILRGRDIKRYKAEWAGLYVILAKFGSHKYLESDYPAVYNHLLQYEDKLKSRGQVRYTSSGRVRENGDYPGQHHWLELDNNPSDEYLDDFNKQKIVYPDIMRLPKTIERANLYPYFYLDNESFYPEATLFIITGSDLNNIIDYLVSDVGFYVYSKFYAGPSMDDTGFRYKKEYLLNLPIIKKIENAENFEVIANLTLEEIILIRTYKSRLLLK